MYCNATLGLLGVDREAPVSPSRSRRKSSHSDLHIFRQARAPGRSLHAAQPRALPVRTAHPCRHVQWSVRLPAPVGTSANNAAAPASPALWPTGAPVAFQLSEHKTLSLVRPHHDVWVDIFAATTNFKSCWRMKGHVLPKLGWSTGATASKWLPRRYTGFGRR